MKMTGGPLNLYFLRLGYDAEFIGTLIGFGQFVWAVMALPAGGIGRRWGTRPALFAWQALHAIGLTLLLFAESLPSHLRTGCIVIGWTVFWIGGAFGGVNATPFLMRVTTPGVRNLSALFPRQIAPAVRRAPGQPDSARLRRPARVS